MSSYLKKKLIGIPQSNVKLVDLFGNYYFKEMSKDEINEKWDLMCIEVPEVRNKKQLEKFLKDVIMTPRMDLRTYGPNRFFLVTNYLDDQSMIIY